MITRRGFGLNVTAAAASFGLIGPSIQRLSGAEPAPHETLADLQARVPKLLEYLAEAIPGISIAAILDGTVAWSAGFGVRGIGRKESVTADTLFEAASLSKPLLAYAVLRLRDAGG